MSRRALLAYLVLAAIIVVVVATRGASTTLLLTVAAAGYALVALGLNIQFGYGGLFNFAIMGFLMLGGMGVSSLSTPINGAFWASEGPVLLLRAIAAAVAGLGLVVLAHRLPRWGVPRGIGLWARFAAWFMGYLLYRSQIDPAAAYIESTSGWVGGLGLPVGLGWAAGGVLAGLAAYVIGKISLGLRSDYLAIATIGMSEIIRAFVKNMDWLTRGTLTVTPVPWPVPLPGAYQTWGFDTRSSFLYGQGGFLLVVLVLLAVAVFLTERAYNGPWGRMMRAIRDNHIAAASMGKDVKARQIEIFVLGSMLMGVGGAMIASFNQLFDPGGYQPINHTFLVWVMVIVGGVGNSFGAVLGGFLVYILWGMSEPISRFIFEQVSNLTTQIGWGAIPEIDSRAAQMRVFVLGLVITLALRYAPKGLLPELVRRGD